MSHILKSEIRQHTIATLRHNGYNPDMYNIAGVIRSMHGPEDPGPNGYSGGIPEYMFIDAVQKNRRKSWAQCSYAGCSNDALRWDVNPMCAEHADEEGISADKLLTLLQEHIDSGTIEFVEVKAMFSHLDIDYPALLVEGVEMELIGPAHIEEIADGLEIVVKDIDEYNEEHNDFDSLMKAVEDSHYSSEHSGPFEFCYEPLCRKATDPAAY